MLTIFGFHSISSERARAFGQAERGRTVQLPTHGWGHRFSSNLAPRNKAHASLWSKCFGESITPAGHDLSTIPRFLFTALLWMTRMATCVRPGPGLQHTYGRGARDLTAEGNMNRGGSMEPRLRRFEGPTVSFPTVHLALPLLIPLPPLKRLLCNRASRSFICPLHLPKVL